MLWLRWYFGPNCGLPDPFWYEFTGQQLEMISAIGHAVQFRGDTARAASRGEGKTSIFERLLTKYTAQGILNFSVLFAATGTLAESSLDSIKLGFEENVLLAADYPEICTPVAALRNSPNRAHFQLCSGLRHDNGKPYEMAPAKFQWSGQEIILPNLPGSPSARAIIATRGLDSAVRGIKRKGRRVQLAGIDDPDTEETARSEDQASKLEERIDRGIAGLGSQKRPVARVMLTTIQSSISASAKFTDPALKPTWRGKRFSFLIKPPEATHLWEEYVQLYKEDNLQTARGERDDPHCRRAHQFYVEHFDQMNEGAQVANVNRFNEDILPDGSQTELTALQHYYNFVARTSPEAASTELDNNPIEVEKVAESGLAPKRIQKKCNGYKRRVMPPDCYKITRGIDCRKVALHWVVRAWKRDGTPFTIDYGIHDVHGTVYGSDEGLDIALKRAILDYLESSAELYGQPIDRTMIDAGWRTQAVYSACQEAGPGVTPIMGFGKSAGCVKQVFTPMRKRTKTIRPGDGWYMSKTDRGLWLCCADADRWKAWEHDRWLTSEGKVGCMTIFGAPHERYDRLSPDEKGHHSYAHHICNEGEVDEPYKGGMRKVFRAKSDNTHWLDASYYSDIGAGLEGVELFGSAVAAAAAAPHEYPTMQELAGR